MRLRRQLPTIVGINLVIGVGFIGACAGELREFVIDNEVFGGLSRIFAYFLCRCLKFVPEVYIVDE